jgi:hypothetical protein
MGVHTHSNPRRWKRGDMRDMTSCYRLGSGAFTTLAREPGMRVSSPGVTGTHEGPVGVPSPPRPAGGVGTPGLMQALDITRDSADFPIGHA